METTLSDSYLIEPEVEEFFTISDKILKLSDNLSEEIIVKNIEEQINEKLEVFSEKINYIEFFKEKYKTIEESSDTFDKSYLQMVVKNISNLVLEGLKKRYKVGLGVEIDFYNNINDYLDDIETLYEFFFIRNFQNLVDYFVYELKRNKDIIAERYQSFSQGEDYQKDLFVSQAKKKFRDPKDILIIHFLNEIITDIIDETDSAFVLFDKITKLDLFEEYNHKFSELLINYGNKIFFEDDREAAKLYL
jgi:hypothetical protein